MDYDDNDFQSQNLHIAGEGSNKFPPALRPYALSKFDFDESLQGNLRFDSLVETEVFLGIESNDDNQWIDAFSRGGSSGIEFSSTAAETCSISRHNNVWSEATSSESVEMLLKSVGQEEFIPKQIVIPESDAFDELACIAKQMNPDPKPDEKKEFEDIVTDLQPLEEEVGMEQSVAGVSESNEHRLSIDGDICQNIDLPVSEGNPSIFTDNKSNITNQTEVVTVAEDLHGDKTQDDSSVSGLQTNVTEVSIQNAGDEEQGALQTPNLPVSEGNRSIFTDNKSNITNQTEVVTVAEDLLGDKTQDDSSVSGLQTNVNKHDLESSDALEVGSGFEGLETGANSLEDSLSMESIPVSKLQKAETFGEEICVGDLSRNSASEDVIVPEDRVMDDQSALSTHELPKVSNDDSVSVAEKMSYGESSVSVTEENKLLNTGDHMDTEILSSKPEISVLSAEENNISRVSEGIPGESALIHENNEPYKQSDRENTDQVTSANDKESKRIPSDSSQIHSDVDQGHLVNKGVGLSSVYTSSVETELTTSTVSIGITPVKNSASPVYMETISSSACEIIDELPPADQVVSSREFTGHDDFHKTTLVGPSVYKKEESATKIAKEAGTSAPVGSSEEDTAPCPISGTEKHNSSDISRQLTCETVSDSLHNVEGTSLTVNIGQPLVTKDDEVIPGCNEEIGVPPVLHESADKQGDSVTVCLNNDRLAVPDNYDKSSPGDDILHGNKASVSSAPVSDSSVELHKTGSSPANNTCYPPSTSRSPSQTEKDKNQVKDSDNQKPPVSELTNTDAKIMLSTAQDLKGNNASKDDKSSTPMVNPVVDDLSKKDIADVNQIDFGQRQPVPVIAANQTSTVVEGSPVSSGLGPSKTIIAGNISHGSPQILGGEVAHNAPKATPARKPRRASKMAPGSPQILDGEVTHSAPKATPARKPRRTPNTTAGSPQISDVEVAHSDPKATPTRKPRRAPNTTPGKESSRKRSNVKDTGLANVSLSPSPGFQLMQSNEAQQYGHIDPNSTKPFALVNASTSSLPDLNTSAAPPGLFHQPFTDIQQVQLRAQIFVYGSLIQSTTPDEAYMISAFGGPDGGRNIWENAWRICMERQHGQKSHSVNPETPLQSRSGARASDSAVKQSAVQAKGILSPLGRASSKATPTTANPVVPLSSPLWNLPTPSCDSLQPSALGRGSVVDYSQAVTSMQPYQTPPLRNFLGHNPSWIPQASPLRGPWIASPSPAPVSDAIKLSSIKGSSLPPSSAIKNVTPGLPASGAGSPSIFVGTASPLDANNVTVSPAQQSSDPKSRKRKKVTVSEDLSQKTLQPPTPAVGSHVSSTSASISTPVGVVPATIGEKSVLSVSPLVEHLKSDQNVEKRILSDESLVKVKEARLHAEEANALSAAAVNHSLEIWTQLDKHKNSGLMPDIEAKLASAAVAVAAAAAVAKAAAAAANVASNAAVQAKLMADEALISSSYENSSQISKISVSEGTSNFGKATPASIIVAAKEAVKRRVEAASAATKRAENMDAIVKAAELAAEAVSQAGKIVTMGDPLSISYLVEAGPEACFKSVGESSQRVGLMNMTIDLVNIDNVKDIPETSNTQSQNRDISSGDICTSVNEKNSGGPKGRKVSDSIKPVDVISESEPQIQASVTVSNGSETLEGNKIKEGSLVEVFKDEEGYKAAWFSANILSLKDGKAYVCYTSLVAVEGAGPLKEWVSLEGEGIKAPRIRTARPSTSLHYEGTKKRRRSAIGDYAWSVGDKVDAWIQQSWWEGVITENNKKDETTFTVRFPASGETSVVRAWHLRPSLIWKDGKWVESPKVVAVDSSTHEGDTPNEKRPKLGNPAVEVKGKDKVSKSINAVEPSNPAELRLLDLTENEKVFNIGNSGKNENKTDTHRMARTGLQKEGSKVIFGVPKPGKKRKFMEVSKHYVAHGSSKTSDRNDSVKISNFLMPQGSGSRGWSNSSKTDTKERPGAADSKPPKTFKSGKPQVAFGRVIPPKGNSSLTIGLAGHTERTKDSSYLNNASQSENQAETAPSSAADGATEGPLIFSSKATSTDAVLPTKRAFASRANKGKLAPAGGKSGKGEIEKASNDNPVKSTADVIEPRRSNRRIQPTSRLLEGLQSSLIISKIPSVSHNRNASKGNNN